MRELPKTKTATRRSKLETASWFAVVRAYLECSRRYTQMLQHFDLTIAQFDALRAIESLGGEATPKAIAERLVVTRANISGVLKRLQERRLIVLRPHGEDGRSMLCAHTPTGQALTAVAHEAASRFVRAQLKPFNNTDLHQVESLMRDMHAHLQTLDPEGIAQPSPELELLKSGGAQ